MSDDRGVSRSDLRAALKAQDNFDGGDRARSFDRQIAWNDWADANPVLAFAGVTLFASLLVHVLVFAAFGFWYLLILPIAGVLGHKAVLRFSQKFDPNDQTLPLALCHMYGRMPNKYQIWFFPFLSAAVVALTAAAWFVLQFSWFFIQEFGGVLAAGAAMLLGTGGVVYLAIKFLK